MLCRCVQIPTEAGREFRTEAGHPAGGSALPLRVSNSGITTFLISDREERMPAKRELTMRQIRQMLRLHHDRVSARAIGRILGVARSTIQDNLKRAEAAGLA